MADTSDLVGKARDIYRTGLNCAQSSLLALSEHWGYNVDARIGSCFGGGIGRTGGHCGILTGSLMALGLLIGTADGADLERKESAARLARKFMGEFRDAAGTVNCRDIVGVDPGTPEGHNDMARRNVKGTICMPLMEKTMHLMADFVKKEGLKPTS